MSTDPEPSDELRRWFREHDLEHPAVRVLWRHASGEGPPDESTPASSPSVVSTTAPTTETDPAANRSRSALGRFWKRLTGGDADVG